MSLLLIGVLIWAKSSDPFKRIEFSVKTNDGKIGGVVVLPKPERMCPVIIYLHEMGGSCLADGRDLRQWAELGFAAVAIDYNQTNDAVFAKQFPAVLEYIRQQSWALPNHTAWIGYSLGAQRTLSYCLHSNRPYPQLLVHMSGGWLDELSAGVLGSGSYPGQLGTADLQFQVLMVHGGLDELIPVSDARKLAGLLASNGVPVHLRILPKVGHAFEPERAILMRVLGEYCWARLMPDHPLGEFTQPHPVQLVVCLVPALLWLGTWWCISWKSRKIASITSPTNLGIGLRVAIIVLTIIILALTALHLILPRTVTSERSLRIARSQLVPAQWKEDFEVSASQPIWKGQKLGTLLEHVGLANYTAHELVNWQLDDSVYRNFVLSASIAPDSNIELNWRRSLWEFYYPRIRGKQTTAAAAEIIASALRERVTICPSDGANGSNPNAWPRGIRTIWTQKITDQDGFERIYVATLRSVGVPARLDMSGKTEFWDTGQWHPAPRPPLGTWRDLNESFWETNSAAHIP